MRPLRTTVLFGAGLLLWTIESPAQQNLGPIPEREREALIALYQATDGPHWKNHDNWQSARGTECDWHGVTCGISVDGGWIVHGLDLYDNNLVGSVPEELGDLTRIEDLLLARNRLSGRLPGNLLRRWEKGPLRMLGYAELIGVSEISLDVRTILSCADSRAVLHADGSVQLQSERCRKRAQGSPRYESSRRLQIFCEIKSGMADRYGDAFGRLARLVETQGFFEFRGNYWRNITHGGLVTTSVVKDGVRRSVQDYAQAGPFGLWQIENAIRGVLADAEWTKTERTKRCEWPILRSELPPPVPRKWTKDVPLPDRVPMSVLESLCPLVLERRASAGNELSVIAGTRNIFDDRSFPRLGAAYEDEDVLSVEASEAEPLARSRADKPMLPLELPPRDGPCRWIAVRIDEVRPGGRIVEVSDPLLNPFADGADERLGFLARDSVVLDERTATWYWVAVKKEPSGRWRATRTIRLPDLR